MPPVLRTLFSLLLTVSIGTSLAAQTQPPICPPDERTVMSPFCTDACIICDIDGFSGRNGRDQSFFLPNDFCTLQQHNGKWIGFIAGSENLRIELAVSNCELNTGLEIGIYEATDCSNPVSVGNCFGGFNSIPPGESRIFENQTPLVVGQYYYVVMDGGRDDVCDWRFTVVEGTTEVAPLTVSGPIFGPTSVCPGIPIAYATEVELGAAAFSWRVNGREIATGQSPEIIWNMEGTFELCVTAANACDQAAPFCTQVTVVPPQTTVIDTIICSNQTFIFNDSTLTESGVYNFDFTSSIGCDSNFVINLTAFVAQEATVALNVCSDDVLELNGELFDQSGSFQQILTNQFGCDSTLNLNLTFIECNITAESIVTNASCNGATNGQISFSVLTGTPPFTFRATDLPGNVFASETITGLNEVTTLMNVSPGQYQVTILDEFGNDTRILNLALTEPAPLSLTTVTSEFSGFPISCFGASDGAITLTPGGGTPPYVVRWNDTTEGLAFDNLAAGTYPYLITDANGCTLAGEIFLEAPPQITAQLAGINADCNGPNTGSIRVLDPTGGAGGFRYRIDGGVTSDSALFSGLSAGVYTVEISDVNNCSSTLFDTLREALIPELDLPEGTEIIELGTSSRISFTAFAVEALSWDGLLAASIVDSSANTITLAPTASGTLIGTAISVDGCVAVDSLMVVVDNPKKIYAPTAFSPNADGINDDFALAAGPGVLQIESLQVFNRWGGVVYEQQGDTGAWDGRDAAAGVYVWRAFVVYLDGRRELISGDVVLLR